MKFFTPELYARCRSGDDAVVGAAEDEWEAALQRYEQHLQAIEPALPAHLRDFQHLLLHDAVLQAVARRGDHLLLIFHKDIPPRDLVVLDYELDAEPAWEPFASHPRDWSAATAFDFDEFDAIHEAGRALYTQEIVFGNGWLLRLRFRDVQVTEAQPIYPAPSGAALPAGVGE
jgi:hypothetical protein